MARWSLRFGLLAIPILLIASVGHRARLIDATATYGIIALGFSIAGLAVIAAFIAFERIWHDGRKGAGAALRGLVLGLLVLSLPAVGAWKVVTLPRLNDISTDLVNPPEFVRAAADRSADDVPIADPGDEDAALQASAYPDIVPRHYPVGPARVYEAALAIVNKRRWTLLDARAPTADDSTGHIEAVAITLIFGFRQDVVIRIVPDGEGALVDMRSAARNAAHDLGADADRIRAFFADLDDALQGTGSS
jgi:uncharacterized protein (DUF1499 family)